MRKGKLKELIKNLSVVIIVTFILISILAILYSFTQQRIKINESLFKKKAILLAAGFTLPFKYNDLIDLYNSSIKEFLIKNDLEIYSFYNKELADSDIFAKGYVLVFKGPGLWGEITVALAFGKDLQTISGIEFINQNETPGLGGRITESWFKKQFRGKKNIVKLVSEKEIPSDDEISAITGATNTTKYVLNLIETGKNYIKSFQLPKFE